MICEALTLNVGSLTSEACYCVVLYDIVIVTNSLKFIHLAVCNLHIGLYTVRRKLDHFSFSFANIVRF